MYYLLHAGLLLAACFGYYWLLLRPETHFQLNRWVLLGCLVGSLFLPLITVPAALSLTGAPVNDTVEISAVQSETNAAIAPESGNNTSTANDTPAAVPPRPTGAESAPVAGWLPALPYTKVLWYGYLVGLLIFGVNFLFQLGQMLRQTWRHPGHDLGEFRLVELREDAAPYSFWNRIFLNPDRYDEDTFHQIVQHERIHVLQKHSLDLLLAELIVVLQWCNPFAWLYRRAIEHNLEFLTDAEMLRAGNDPERYQLSLVQVTVPNFPNGLATSYNQSFLERRINMMKTKKSSPRSGWKYLTLLALLTLSVLQFNAVAQTNPQPVVPPGEALAAAPSASTMADVPPIKPKLTEPRGVDASLHSWTALIEGAEICFQFSSRGDAHDNDINRWNYQTSRCFSTQDFPDLPRGQMGDFVLTRSAGTMTFKGIFDGNDGVGKFDFSPDADFTQLLDSRGYGEYNEHEMVLFFMADMDRSYLDFLKDQGYDPDHEELLQLAIFYEDQDELKNRLVMLDRYGYEQPDMRNVIQLEIHGVNEAYIEEMEALGFTDLSLKNLTEGRIHRVSRELLDALSAAGYADLSFDEAKQMGIHGIEAGFIQSLTSFGFTDLSAREVVDAKIHGMDEEKLSQLKALGIPIDDFDKVKQAAIHNIDGDLIRGLRSIGYEDLTVQEFIQASIHGVKPEWVMEYRELGFKNIPFDTLIQLRVHGVSADFIKDNIKEGRDLKDYVKMKIIGL